MRYFIGILILVGNILTHSFAQTVYTWEMNDLSRVGDTTTTMIGAPVLMDTPLGKAIQFDGIDDGLIVHANPLVGANEFTVEVVFKHASGGNYEQRFVHMEQDNNNRILIELRSRPDKTWFLDTFIKSGASSKTLVDSTNTHVRHATDMWYHAALVYKNKTMTHYVDGVQELTGAVTFAPVTSGQTSIGMRLNNIYFYKGAVKTVKVTHQALTPSEFISNQAVQLNQVTAVDEMNALENMVLAPNPSNHDPALYFQLEKLERLTIKVQNLLGETLIEKQQFFNEGHHSVMLSTEQLSAGIYLVDITLGQKRTTKRMIIAD